MRAQRPMGIVSPFERVLHDAWLGLGLMGVEAVVRCVFSRHVPSVLVERRRVAELELAAARGSTGEERALYAAGVALLRELAARSLSRAIDRLADPACDMRGVMNELRETVDLVRRCQNVERADAMAARGERAVPPRRRQRRVVEVMPRGEETAA